MEMNDEDEVVSDLLRQTAKAWTFDAERIRSEALRQHNDRSRDRGRLPALVFGIVVGSMAVAIALIAIDPSGDSFSQDPGTVPGEQSVAPTRCSAPAERPTYLPWLDGGQIVPAPFESYDAEIGRAQLYWGNPGFPEGEAGVALSLYTYDLRGNQGEPTDIMIRGVAGRLHKDDEGGLLTILWDFETPQCNLMELTLAAPGLTENRAAEQLVGIAQSLG
jgi:hypothetical protein